MIGIYGDSFTDLNPKEFIDREQGRMPWLMHLSDILGDQMETHGFAATSIWWSYQRFLKSYTRYSTIVFGYSNYNRWHSINYRQYGTGDPDFVGPLSHVFHADQLNLVQDKFKPLALQLVRVHPYLYDDDFNLFVYQTIFDSVNSLCGEAGIKLVNLMPFENTGQHPELQISIDRRAGACLTNLLSVSGLEYYNKDQAVFAQVNQMNRAADRRFCHINPYNNRALAEIIAESLDRKQSHINLVKSRKWSYDPVHLKYLIDLL